MRAGALTARGSISASTSRSSNWSITSSCRVPGSLKSALPKLIRTTGWRFDHSQLSWMCSPRNSGSLPSNNSFSVSRNRLLPNRRGRDRK